MVRRSTTPTSAESSIISPRPIKACLQSPAGKEKRDQTNESSKAGIGLFVASCDASESLEMAEEVFDQMAPFVHFCIVRDALGPVGLGGNDRDCAAFVQVGTQPVVVEGFVADQGLKIETGDQGLDTDAVVPLARQQQEANEIPECVHQGHDLGSQAAARAAYGLILSPPFAPVPCWWTRTNVASMRTYSKSESSDRCSKIRSHTSFAPTARSACRRCTICQIRPADRATAHLSEPPTTPLPQTDDCRLPCVPDHRSSLAVQVRSVPVGRCSIPCESRLTSIFQP